MTVETALSEMHDAVALWCVDQGSAADIVHAACELLVAGLDGPSECTDLTGGEVDAEVVAEARRIIALRPDA